MSSPTPVQSFVGGIGLSLPVYALLVLNGSTLGISGFIHSSLRGSKESAIAVAGLILGGIAVSGIERVGPGVGMVGDNLWSTVFSGLLVGVGTKVLYISALNLCTGLISFPDVEWLHIGVSAHF
jgi:uncharacterized protein